MVPKREGESACDTHPHTDRQKASRIISPSFLPPHSIFLLPHIRLCCCFSLLAFSCFYFTFFLFLCACVGCVCVVSFGICFLFCLTFFTFSTRLLIEVFHSFLLRSRVYPYTHTHMCPYCCSYIWICMCVRSQDLHLAPFRCTTPMKMFSHFTVGTREKGSTLLLSLCVCVCVYATFVCVFYTSFYF